MTEEKFIEMALLAAKSVTIYAKGCFGWPMNEANKKRAINSYIYNAAPERQKIINAADAGTFAFDCICLIKAILWDWIANPFLIYGGADYKSNGVPDFDTETMLDHCTDVSQDFTKIVPGEVLHNPGHAGIYIGNGLAVEATPRWKDGVQITAVLNMGDNKEVNNARMWQEHGKLEYVEYSKPQPAPVTDYKYKAIVDIVRKGSSGASVVLVQMLLNERIGTELQLDGKAGTKTVAAVRKFQEINKLDADGVVGTKTWSALLGIEVQRL